MRRKPFLVIASALILTVSCNREEEARPTWTFEENQKQIVFFSDKEKFENEISYYDAIIQLKKDYPDEIKNMKTLSPSQMDEFAGLIHVENCPAIIVFYNNKVIAEVTGEATTEDITTPIANVLSKTY